VETDLERVIGAAVLAVLGAVIALTLATDCRHVLRSGRTIHVELGSTGALHEGSAVQIAGERIGQVEAIRLQRTVVLDIFIDDDYAHLVRDNSDFFVTRPSLLSEPYVELALPAGAAPGPELADGATVTGIDPPNIDQLLQTAYDLLVALTGAMRAFPELTELDDALAELDAAIDGIDTAAARRAVDSADQLARDARALADAAGADGDTLAQLARIAERGRAVAARLQRTVDRVRDRVAAARASADVAGIAALDLQLEQIDRLAAELDALLAVAERGSIGALMSDAELVDDVKDLTRMLKRESWKLLGKPGHQLDTL
jgi:ABC-type transporter Mla subunit MlaD